MTEAKAKKIGAAIKQLSSLVTVATEEDVLRIKGGKFSVKGKDLPPDLTEQLLAEAKIFKNGALWKALSEDVLFSSGQKLLKKGKVTDDIIFHRAIEYVLVVLQKKIDYLAKVQYSKDDDKLIVP
jgi:hypothetical protein